MEFVGLALAIPGIADLCLKYGRSLVEKFQSYKNAHHELAELIQRFRSNWKNLDLGIGFFKKVEHRLEREIRLHFYELAQRIHSKLLKIHLKIESASNERDNLLVRMKFAFLLKASLLDAIKEFEIWHKLLLDLLFLLTRTSDPVIERTINDERMGSEAISRVQKLRQAIKPSGKGAGTSVFLTTDGSFWNDRKPIQYTSITTKKLPRDGRTVLIDSIPWDTDNSSEADPLIGDIRDLARVLREVDPMVFGIPTCEGVVKVQSPTGMPIKLEMVFKVPSQLRNPRSLRGLLVSQHHHQDRPEHAINERIQLAKRLARTVLFVHSANFVHKNFHPETIIIFDTVDNPGQGLSRNIGIPLLVGFQKVRLATGPTLKRGDTEWDKNLYRHPTRQGQYPEETYKMQHDIYSLGVCLLEIALWKSFVLWDEQRRTPLKSVEAETLLKDVKNPHDVKRRLVEMAREMIPKILGNQYTEVTIACLTCLDKTNQLGDASEFMDEDGISVGVRYIEKILGKLEEISV